jgi:hypothetical protein
VDRQTIQEKVIGVLSHIQAASGYAAKPITDAIKPLEDLEGFDSQMGVTATSLLAPDLGMEIPADCNIFREKGGNRPLTVREAVDVLVGIGVAKSAARSGQGAGAASATNGATTEGSAENVVSVTGNVASGTTPGAATAARAR